MDNQRIYLSAPHMGGNEQHYINHAFETNWIAPLGSNVDLLEKRFAEYTGTKGAVAVNSGTAAIHLGLQVLGITKGDIVFCSSLTFIASANPIIYQGAIPVFIDSEEDSWNMSPVALEKALETARKNHMLPKAIILVHIFGQCSKLDEILAICQRYEVPIIEDAAESLGSMYKGKQTGSFGSLGIYSLNGNKIITSSGGGILVSNNEELLQQARFLATQARDKALHYQHSKIGYNYRLSNILAGVGIAQLEVLEERVHLRRGIFKRYKTALEAIEGIKFMPSLENTRGNRWLTALTIDKKEIGLSVKEVIQTFEAKNIEVRHVWKPLHIQPVFRNTDFYSENSGQSVSEWLFKRGICLPSGSGMTIEEQDRVIDVLKTLLKVK